MKKATLDPTATFVLWGASTLPNIHEQTRGRLRKPGRCVLASCGRNARPAGCVRTGADRGRMAAALLSGRR